MLLVWTVAFVKAQTLSMEQLRSSKINDIEFQVRVHVNICTGLVNGPTIWRWVMRMKPTVLALSDNRHPTRSCQPKDAMGSARGGNEIWHSWTEEWTIHYKKEWHLPWRISWCHDNGNGFWQHYLKKEKTVCVNNKENDLRNKNIVCFFVARKLFSSDHARSSSKCNKECTRQTLEWEGVDLKRKIISVSGKGKIVLAGTWNGFSS